MQEYKKEEIGEVLKVSEVVALRKVEFFKKLWSEIRKYIPESFDEEDVKNLKDAFKSVISKMDNSVFLDKEGSEVDSETTSKEIEIDKEKMEMKFFKTLKELYPKLEDSMELPQKSFQTKHSNR